MSSAKRKLFSSGPTGANVRDEENGPAEDVVYTVVSEGDSLPKESGSPCSLHNVNDTDFHAPLNKVRPHTMSGCIRFIRFAPVHHFFASDSILHLQDLAGKILIVGEGREAIHKQFANMKLPRSVELLCSSSGDVASVCSKERFLFIVLDISCKANNALKLCSTIR